MINREIIKSVKFIMENGISKSVAHDLHYESSVKMEKTGAEIKSKLKLTILDSIMSKNKLMGQLDQIVADVCEMPSLPMEDYELKGFRSRLTAVPLKYPYEENYQGVSLKNKYNNLLREYIDLSVDCIILKTVIDNIDVNKSYQLSVDLTSKIGF